ncbi:MAG: RNA polymerase sigma factor [Acidimicrobiales bacterium]
MTPPRLDRQNSDAAVSHALELSPEDISAARRGDQDVWERLYLVYSRHLFAFLMMQLSHADDAAEALSETYLRAIEKISTFRGGPPSLKPWMFTIARNVAMDRLRARKRVSIQADIDDIIDITALEPADRVIGLHERDSVEAAMASLPADDREVLWLRFGEGLTSAEVAKVVGRRAGAVRMQQMRALQVIASMVER